VWTYALALNNLVKENQSLLADIHSNISTQWVSLNISACSGVMLILTHWLLLMLQTICRNAWSHWLSWGVWTNQVSRCFTSLWHQCCAMAEQ
jgi:hypothetical protein